MEHHLASYIVIRNFASTLMKNGLNNLRTCIASYIENLCSKQVEF